MKLLFFSFQMLFVAVESDKAVVVEVVAYEHYDDDDEDSHYK